MSSKVVQYTFKDMATFKSADSKVKLAANAYGVVKSFIACVPAGMDMVGAAEKEDGLLWLLLFIRKVSCYSLLIVWNNHSIMKGIVIEFPSVVDKWQAFEEFMLTCYCEE